ncbi:unnamed protein product, partial [Tuber aestivum]
ALAATAPDHPYRGWREDNLGHVIYTRFKHVGALGDLQSAIDHGEAALAATPIGSPDRMIREYNLGGAVSARFERIGDINDLQKAIKHREEALKNCPKDHPDRARMCASLGGDLQLRHLNLHSVGDLNEGILLYREAYRCRTSPPRYRMEAAHKAAFLLYSSGRFHESSFILEDAVDLMPRIDLRFLKRDDQQHILSELSGLASIAASVTLQAGRGAYASLKLLELGRGIIMGFSIESRSDFSDLKTSHPLLFDKFHTLRLEIDSPVDVMDCKTNETPDQRRNRTISRRWEAVNEMEEILKRIRSVPGYDRFLLPPSRNALMKMAAKGPIVVFNSTICRSDAIIVTTSSITSIELPKLRYEETGRRMRQFAGFGGGGENVHDPNLKRIWWIGVGQLSVAPFHAAGDHTRGSTCNTLSRAISTYIPTIKALTYAR